MWNSEKEMESEFVDWYKSSDDFEMCRISSNIYEGSIQRQYRLKSGKICDIVIFNENRKTVIELKNRPIQPKDLLQLYGYINEIDKMEYLISENTGTKRDVSGILIGTEIGSGFDRVYRTLIANMHGQLDIIKLENSKGYLTSQCIWYNYFFENHG